MSGPEASVCHRSGPLTARDYDEAITDLLAAKHALERGERGGCDVCGSDEYWPSECDHNPLRLAREAAAKRAVYRCWHCGYEARNHEEGIAHFGRTEFEEPACRRPYRSMDASGSPEAAQSVGWKWIDEVAVAAQATRGPVVSIESSARHSNDWYAAVFVGTELAACAFVFRDQMNFAVLIRWLPAVEPEVGA